MVERTSEYARQMRTATSDMTSIAAKKADRSADKLLNRARLKAGVGGKCSGIFGGRSWWK
jgi:hypothetical protein